MPDKPIDEYEFYKDIINRKKNSGCSACRQEGFMLEAQVMDMMRERLNGNKVSASGERDGIGVGGTASEPSDNAGTAKRNTGTTDPTSK